MVTKLETKQKNGTKYYGGQWLPITVLCATILKNIVFYIQQKKETFTGLGQLRGE